MTWQNDSEVDSEVSYKLFEVVPTVTGSKSANASVHIPNRPNPCCPSLNGIISDGCKVVSSTPIPLSRLYRGRNFPSTWLLYSKAKAETASKLSALASKYVSTPTESVSTVGSEVGSSGIFENGTTNSCSRINLIIFHQTLSTHFNKTCSAERLQSTAH
jgi:hypothetical protein